MNPERRSKLPPVAFRSFVSRYSIPRVTEGLQDIVDIDFKVPLPTYILPGVQTFPARSLLLVRQSKDADDALSSFMEGLSSVMSGSSIGCPNFRHELAFH